MANRVFLSDRSMMDTNNSLGNVPRFGLGSTSDTLDGLTTDMVLMLFDVEEETIEAKCLAGPISIENGERGIRAPAIARRNPQPAPPAVVADNNQDNNDAEDGDDVVVVMGQPANVVPIPQRRRTRQPRQPRARRRPDAPTPDSDAEDDDEDDGNDDSDERQPVTVHQPIQIDQDEATTTTEATKASAKRKSAPVTSPSSGKKAKTTSKSKKKPTKRQQSDSEESDLDDPLRDILPKSSNTLPRSKHSKLAKNATSSTNAAKHTADFCQNCKRRFVPDIDAPNATMCQACLTVGSGPKVRKVTKKKNAANVVEDSNEKLMSLKDICIRIVAENIDSVDEFGDIPDDIKIKISKILSRNRTLDLRTMNLFLGPHERTVELFDCSRLDEAALKGIAQLCPNVTRLNLSFCGRMTVKDEAYGNLFSTLGSKLVELHLENAAKLSEVGSTVVEYLSSLVYLENLRLDALGQAVKGVSDEVLLKVIKAVGKSLKVLKIEGFPEMGDEVLEGIGAHCPLIRKLSLRGCSSLNNDAFVSFFSASNTKSPLTDLNLQRCENVGDTALVALINIHGASLVSLSLNGLEELTEYSLRAIGATCHNLRDLDLSWVRQLDDDLFESIIDRCRNLEQVAIFGCNRLSEVSLRRSWVNREDRSIKLIGNEFD
ncbi:hypothetical protein SmJEL517_g03401 [Synchytrium microbalum]|uniref:F-box/LRR-repeat protein 15-like leucin rich repeat domain-containing protein n=1 Tax=Synchytrium microbalum TaxID=1806994 RepID=A0A507C2Y4_9FUNG|nr:uncharacterized protein SmJEL517_g03401 [Synchytrium microbalum]TPX33728.1 hypothetical protein SmJEL517_g03401 [Synchytrium microbalum]